MRKNLPLIILASILILQSALLHAREPYHATVTVSTESVTISAPNMSDLSQDLRGDNLQSLIPFYTPTSPVSIDINLRGIDVVTSFAANSTTLIVEIPQAGTTQVFTGTTREESIQLFSGFIRDGGSKHKLLRAYARFSPIDPIAGNPNSLMAQMAQADFLLGQLSPLSGCNCCWSSQPIVHQYQNGLYAGRAFSKGFDTTTVTLPIRTSYSPQGDWALIFDFPVTYNRNGGASSLFGSLALALRLPITCNWSLTPSLRWGTGGSADLCTFGSFISVGATSVFHYKINQYVLSITNYAGYFTSTNLWLSARNLNYHLHNYVFKNGLSLTSCNGFVVCNRPINFSLSLIDSYFAREKLFINHYDEVGFSLFTTHVNPLLCYDCLSVGLSYQFGKKSYKGYRLNLTYQF